MSEAAGHGVCEFLRQRNIDLAELLIEGVAAYPFLMDAPELVRLGVALQAIAPCCSHCPYWSVERSSAPRLCPPARAMTLRTPSDGGVDAELVGDE
jgi:hypothetical protein